MKTTLALGALALVFTLSFGCGLATAGEAATPTVVEPGVPAPKGAFPTKADVNMPDAERAANSAHGSPDAPLWVQGQELVKGDPIGFALGDYLIVGLKTPLKTALEGEKLNNKFGLFINDLYLKDLPALTVPGRENAVMFHLKRTDENRDVWSELFTRKTFARSMACEAAKHGRVVLATGYPDGSKTSDPVLACLQYFPDEWLAGALLSLAGAICIATVLLSRRSSMIRNAGIAPPNTLASYSLARTQMALWFVTVVCGFLWTFAITGDMSPIPDGALILMGIGAGTAIGAASIDGTGAPAGSKRDYLAAKAQQVLLDRNAAAELVALNAANAAGVVDGTLAAAQKKYDDAAAAAVNANRVKSFEVPASRRFILDILSDGDGIAFHRLQVAAWTLVFWSMFVIALWHKVTMIDFSASQLALMGISGATYLGFKLQEKPK